MNIKEKFPRLVDWLNKNETKRVKLEVLNGILTCNCITGRLKKVFVDTKIAAICIDGIGTPYKSEVEKGSIAIPFYAITNVQSVEANSLIIKTDLGIVHIRVVGKKGMLGNTPIWGSVWTVDDLINSFINKTQARWHNLSSDKQEYLLNKYLDSIAKEFETGMMSEWDTTMAIAGRKLAKEIDNEGNN